MKTLNILIALVPIFLISSNIFSQTPCVDGMSGIYPCQNITMLSQLTASDVMAEDDDGVYVNDIWGWTDPITETEYVILGMANGTSFVDISDPLNPVVIGILPEHHQAESSSRVYHDGAKSLWRDIKVYKDHAFMVSEDIGHGMQVFDLTQLRDVTSTPDEFAESGFYSGISNAHNIVINEETGFAYAVGATGGGQCVQGGLHIINIQDPKKPVYEACFDNDGYTHDAQCVIYNGPDEQYQGREICFNSNENSITIVDVDDKSDMFVIGKSTYNGVAYAHQGWLTEDQRYFLSNDELDEARGLVSNTRTFIWDLINLNSPVLIGYYDHVTESIDHNLYVSDGLAFESNYTSGLRVLDLDHIKNGKLRETAFFDLYPNDDNPQFLGTWSNYPFFESGVIPVSHMTDGLFLLQLDFTSNYIVKQPEDIELCLGDSLGLGIEVGGENATFNWQIDDGSGFVDIDDFTTYANTQTDSLQILATSEEMNGLQFRCELTNQDDELIYSEPATLTITQTGDNSPIANFDYIVDGAEVSFTNNSTNADTYSWDFGDASPFNSKASPTYNYYDVNMDFDVTLVVYGFCSSDSISQTIATILSSQDKTQGFNIYPNPSSSIITLSGHAKYESYKVLTLSGQLRLQGNLAVQNQKIDIEALVPGYYILLLDDGQNNSLVKRIMVE